MTFLRALPCQAVILPKADAPMCGPHFCSMKITEDVRKFAAQQQISERDALQVGGRRRNLLVVVRDCSIE